jgi:hypothetical protein
VPIIPASEFDGRFRASTLCANGRLRQSRRRHQSVWAVYFRKSRSHWSASHPSGKFGFCQTGELKFWFVCRSNDNDAGKPNCRNFLAQHSMESSRAAKLVRWGVGGSVVLAA